MKASDIKEDDLIAEIDKATINGIGCPIWAIFKAFPQYPEKVIRAKLSTMIRRKLLTGCCCGCRGDFKRKENK